MLVNPLTKQVLNIWSDEAREAALAKRKGMGTGTKVGLGLGAALGTAGAVAGGVLAIRKNPLLLGRAIGKTVAGKKMLGAAKALKRGREAVRTAKYQGPVREAAKGISRETQYILGAKSAVGKDLVSAHKMAPGAERSQAIIEAERRYKGRLDTLRRRLGTEQIRKSRGESSRYKRARREAIRHKVDPGGTGRGGD
jgi:hypothetical protein